MQNVWYNETARFFVKACITCTTKRKETALNALPMTRADMDALGWDRPDFVLVTGDAYIDHPSFGTAIVARVLESRGYRVAILAQPAWKSCADFKRFGRPRLAFLVNSGNIDSMVNHYTAAKKPRSTDAYTPGGQAGLRPDRALIVYTNRIREAFRKMPIVIGGVEASLRRFAHYDYWDDKVRRSILVDAGADLLIYGMGERPIVEIADALQAGTPISQIDSVLGTAYLREGDDGGFHPPNPRPKEQAPLESLLLPSFESVSQDKEAYGQAYLKQKEQTDAMRSLRLLQPHGRQTLIVNPPQPPLTRAELDAVYALPYTRLPHPSYTEHIPALDEVEWSIASCRGCFGSCSFCALTFHQGRVVQSRSSESILQEARAMVKSPRFKGYIHDVGGPTANFRDPACDTQRKGKACSHRQCLHPKPCEKLRADHTEYTELLRKLRGIPGVKKVFVRSGLRYDYILHDEPKRGSAFLRELLEHHVSGQLKIAPEHVASTVLDLMGKPEAEVYERFVQKFKAVNEKLGKEQYIVPYFMSSHPGSDLHAAIALACYMRERGIRPEQVQDFYPTPGTLSTTIFYTGVDPRNGRLVFVPRTPKEKRLQRALLQSYRLENAPLVREALRQAGRDDLIGFGAKALVRPEGGTRPPAKRRASTPQARPARGEKKGKPEAKSQRSDASSRRGKPPRGKR